MSNDHLAAIARIWHTANDTPLTPGETREIRDRVMGLFLLLSTWHDDAARTVAG